MGTYVNPPDGVQLKLPLDPAQKSYDQTIVVKLEMTVVTRLSKQQRIKLPSPEPAAIIVGLLKSERFFVYIFSGSLPSDWDLDKNGAKLKGAAKRERLFRLARENGWFDCRL